MNILGSIILILLAIIFFISGILLWKFQATTKRPLKGYWKMLNQVFAFALVILAFAAIIGGIGLFFFQKTIN